MIYTPNISWETKVENVSLSSTGTHYYECTLPVKNLNDKGAGTLNTDLYLIDYLGYFYSIVNIIDSSTNTVEVYDINEGEQYSSNSFKAPYQDMIGFVCELTGGHIGLSSAQIRRLHQSARDTINYQDNLIIWHHAQMNSSGVVSDIPSITDNGDGTITIESTLVRVWDNSLHEGYLYEYNVLEKTLTLTQDDTNFVYVDYNSGNPEYFITTDQTIINESDTIPVYTLYARGATVTETLDWDHIANGLANKLHKRHIFTERFKRESGLSVSEYSTRNIQIESGIVWQGVHRISLALFESDVGNFIFYYYDGTSWVRDETTTQYNNSQYNPTTGLTILNNNYYTVNWIYRSISNDSSSIYVLGDEQYNKLSDALNSTPRNDLPDIIEWHYILVARIIVGQGNSTAELVENSFDDNYYLTTPTSHSSLTDLYGSSELYHVSQQVYTDLHDVNAQLAALHTDGSPTFNDIVLSNGIQIGNSTITTEGNIRCTGSDFEGYLDGEWTSFTKGGGYIEINQASHGFNYDFIYHNGTSWVKAQADTLDNCATHFAISKDTDNFYLYNIGEIDSSSMTDESSSALTSGSYYFLSQTTPGKVTPTQPSDGIVQSVLKENTSGNASILIEEPYDINAWSTTSSGDPGGNDGQLQYNNGGTFGGTQLEWDDSTNTFSWGCAAEDGTLIKIQDAGDYNAVQGLNFMKLGYTDGSNFNEAIRFSVDQNAGKITFNGHYSSDWGKIECDGGVKIENTWDTNNCYIKVGDPNINDDNHIKLITNEYIENQCSSFIIDCNFFSINANYGVYLKKGNSSYPTIGLSEGVIIRLKNHSSDPDGLYYYNGSTWQGVNNKVYVSSSEPSTGKEGDIWCDNS